MNLARRMTLELPKLMLLGLISMSLAGCLSTRTLTTETIYVDTGCSTFGPITYSGTLTDAPTREQIRQHNHVYDTLCE